MRNVLMLLQFALAGMLLVFCLMLFFHDFGKPLQTDEFLVRHRIGGDGVVSLEQLRTWSDLIVQKDLFSPRRGQSAPQAAEPWTDKAPPFELVAVMGRDGGRTGVFIPAGADRKVTPGVIIGAGGTLMKDVTVVEIREGSAVVRKPDGLFEIKLPQDGMRDRVKISTPR
ncbi:MAG: hypothetical protein PHI85_01275 [Victivallaceae bacterium]|nr:hypothetical protein [Victivallaceae bacterium]